jgi:hypothetical protein
MAFNQASFFLFAPGFGPAVECDHNAKTASGKPLEIVSTCSVDSTAPKVFTEDLRRWLVDRRFCEKERHGGLQALYRGRHTTSLGTQEAVELKLPLDEDVIQVLYIRFLLTEQTPEQISEWRDLTAELGHDFGFQIMDEDHRLLPCIDFPAVLAEIWNFCAFKKNYGWKI